MLRLAQRSSVLGTSVRLLASASVGNLQDRCASTKKAVVFNMGGSLVPAMSPVISKYAREHKLTEAELTSKLFVDGNQELLEEIEPSLLSRHGSVDANLAYVVSAIKSIRGEGLKTALVSNANGLNADLIPVDKELFDVVSPDLKGDLIELLKVDPNEIVYLDNLEANLKAAVSLGLTTVNVGDVEATLKELESHLKVPLKEFIPGFTWIYYDNAHSPNKSTGENILYYLLCLYIFMVTGHMTCKHVLKIDGTFQH